MTKEFDPKKYKEKLEEFIHSMLHAYYREEYEAAKKLFDAASEKEQEDTKKRDPFFLDLICKAEKERILGIQPTPDGLPPLKIPTRALGGVALEWIYATPEDIRDYNKAKEEEAQWRFIEDLSGEELEEEGLTVEAQQHYVKKNKETNSRLIK